MNRRVAAHRNRKGPATAMPEEMLQAHHSANSRAAAAAARVAARYANAPSYSEILAAEARTAVRAAEAASWAALEAQAAAESVLAGIEAASAIEPVWEVSDVPPTVPAWQSEWQAEPVRADAAHAVQARPPFAIHWVPDLPARHPEPDIHAIHGPGVFQAATEALRETEPPVEDEFGREEIPVMEPGLPIHANLIEFPRELVAPRKARPRLAEHQSTVAAEPVSQLSIFEVDPDTITSLPAVEEPPAWTGHAWTLREWKGPEWAGLELGAQPAEMAQAEVAPQASLAPELKLAPLHLRAMAAVVNVALITGAFLVAAAVTAANTTDLPSLREMATGSAAALLAIGALYHLLFYTLAKATPGMKYAHISLCTFNGRIPGRIQRCGRLGALLLSLMPVGLGVVWAIFDEGHLCWHDRLSKTYLRRY